MNNDEWTALAKKHLQGLVIKNVRFMNDEELEQQGWDDRSLVMEFNNGHILLVSSDDEGNGPGSLFTSFEDLPIIPTLRD